MTKKEEKPKQPQAEPEKNDALAAMLATIFAIYRLRDHREETDE